MYVRLMNQYKQSCVFNVFHVVKLTIIGKKQVNIIVINQAKNHFRVKMLKIKYPHILVLFRFISLSVHLICKIDIFLLN